VIDSTAALEGAHAILVERFTEDATLIGTLREEVWSLGVVSVREFVQAKRSGCQVHRLFRVQRASDYIAVGPRIVTLFRGEKQEVLILELVPDPAAPDRDEPSAVAAGQSLHLSTLARSRGDRKIGNVQSVKGKR
jgi:protein Tex